MYRTNLNEMSHHWYCKSSPGSQLGVGMQDCELLHMLFVGRTYDRNLRHDHNDNYFGDSTNCGSTHNKHYIISTFTF